MAEALRQRIFLASGSIGKSIVELVFLLIMFALVLAACVVTTRFVAGRQIQRRRDSNFKPLDTYQIAQNRYLQLVQIGTRYFVISVSKDSVGFIAELKEEELTKKDFEEGKPKSFKEILSDLKVKVDKHEDAGK
jgi:flagellar protein FliO/FliZ